MSNLQGSTIPLRKLTLTGLVWTFTDAFFLRGFSFIASLVFARLLGPVEFGLLGMTTLFISIGTSLVDSGLTSSLIRTQNTDETDYSTVFFMGLITSILVYVILFISAPYIALFYHQPILIAIIRIYCLSFIIASLSSVQLTILNKEMQFRKIMFYNLPGTLIGAIAGIIMAYKNFGVWSIVGMYLITQTVQSALLWTLSKWKPNLTFSREKMKFHYDFGYKLMLSSLIDTLYKNIYNVVIGKFFSIRLLGYYERANTFNEYPVTILTGIIAKVSFPLLARIQNEKERIATLYKQLLQFTFFITAPLMLGAAAIAKPLFLLFLGNQWLPAVPFFKIICLASMLYPIHVFNINILKVYGRSDLFLRLEIIKKVIITISIIISFRFGVTALIWSTVSSSFIALLINTYYSSEMINYTTTNQLKDMLPTLLTSVVVYLIMNFIVVQISAYALYFQIIVPGISGILFYLIFNYMIKSAPLLFSIQFIKRRRV